MPNILKEEIQNDPKHMGYAAFYPDCPGTIADMMMAKTLTSVSTRYCNARTVMAELGMAGVAILDALRAASETVTAVKWILPFLTMPDGIDVGNPVTQGMIDQLAVMGKLTTEQATALKGLALQKVSRAQQLGLDRVTALDVTNAFLE